MFPFADYMSTGRDYDGLSLSGYRRSSCYAAAAAATNHHDNAGGRSSVGKPRDLITTERNPCFFRFHIFKPIPVFILAIDDDDDVISRRLQLQTH